MKPTKEEISALLPNTFPFPNIIVDCHPALKRSIWSCLTGSEQNALTILYRKTFGWWKKRDRIANSQLKEMTGLSEETLRKVMNSLCAFGLAIKLSDGSDGLPIEWESQTNDSQINFPALIDRRNKIDEINRARWDKGRQNIGVLSDNTPPVAQAPGDIVAQDPGGIVAQGTQKPIKTTNQKPNKGRAKNARQPSGAMPDRFPSKFESLANTFIKQTGLKCESKQEYDFWCWGNKNSRQRGFDSYVLNEITSNDIIQAMNGIRLNNKKNPGNPIVIKAPNSLFSFAFAAKQIRTGYLPQTQEGEPDQELIDILNGESR